MTEPLFNPHAAPALADLAAVAPAPAEALPPAEPVMVPPPPPDGKDFRTRTKRKPSYPFKMLAGFADGKGHHPAQPELALVLYDNRCLMSTDGTRMLLVRRPDAAAREPQYPQLLTLDLFSKLKEKDDAPALLDAWLAATKVPVPVNCDVRRFPPWLGTLPACSRILVHRYRLMDRLELVGKMDKGDGVRMIAKDGALVLMSVAESGAETVADVLIRPSNTCYQDFDVRVNADYLFTALDVAQGEHVHLSLLNEGDVYALHVEGDDPAKQVEVVVALAREPEPEE